MRFTPTEEQEMFRDSVRRFVAEEYPFDRRLRIVAGEPGYLGEHWNAFAELGWLGVPFPEELGGLGGSSFDVAVLMEEFGRGLVVSPYLSTVLLSGRILMDADSAPARALIGEIIAGSAKVSAALHEPQGRYDLHDVATTAERAAHGWHLSGRKVGVPFGGSADRLIVSARTAGSRRDVEGITLFLIGADAKGIAVERYRTHDGGSAAVVDLARVAVDGDAVLGTVDRALPLIERAADVASAALAAEMVGAMEAAQQATVAYAKTRKQFDQNLGQFQALQHRMVDMFMKCELSRSMAIEAADGAALEDPAERARRVAAARALIGRHARHVCEEAVQLHGGVGVTMEVPVGHHLKRVMAINATLGDPAFHRRRYLQLLRGADNLAAAGAV